MRLPDPARRTARCSTRARELGGEAVERATRAPRRRPTTRSRARGVADRVQLDLGLLRDLGYYTGAILEVYDPALGHVLGGGGRYDELMGRFGEPLPGCRVRALPRAPPHRPGRGGASNEGRRRGREADPGRGRGPDLTRAAARGAASARRSTCSTRSASTPTSCAATRARSSSTPASSTWSRCGRPTCRPTSRPAPPTSGSPARTCSPSSATAPSTSSSTSATGPAGWCSPARRGDERLGESRSAASGAMRIATKYPRTAERYFERTGRQAEVIEVKGSVELAPLVGLADGDRRPRRHRPHPGRERARGARGDRDSHRAPGRQPRRPQAARGRGRRPRRAPHAWRRAPDEDRADRVGRRRRRRAGGAPAHQRAGARRRGQRRGRARSSPRFAPAATRRCASSPSELGDAGAREPARRPGGDRGRARTCSEPPVREALRARGAATSRRSRGPSSPTSNARPRSSSPQGQRIEVRASPVAAAGVYAPGGRAAYPSSVLMCVHPGPGGRRRPDRVATPPAGVRAPERGRPRRLRDRRGRRGLRDRRRPGDRRARLRYRERAARST